MTGKSVLIWTHPGSQGWRPVGGLVMHGVLLEVGIPHTLFMESPTIRMR